MRVNQSAKTVVAAALLMAAQDGFCTTGNVWNGLSYAEKNYCVAGVIDTWGEVELLRLSEKPTPPANVYTLLTSCSKRGMTYPQFEAIVQKWADANPEKWHLSMTALVLQAMADTCHLKRVDSD
jgi:hypothetical protein